jgi:hypothetical protein
MKVASDPTHVECASGQGGSILPRSEGETDQGPPALTDNGPAAGEDPALNPSVPGPQEAAPGKPDQKYYLCPTDHPSTLPLTPDTTLKLLARVRGDKPGQVFDIYLCKRNEQEWLMAVALTLSQQRYLSSGDSNMWITDDAQTEKYLRSLPTQPPPLARRRIQPNTLISVPGGGNGMIPIRKPDPESSLVPAVSGPKNGNGEERE